MEAFDEAAQAVRVRTLTTTSPSSSVCGAAAPTPSAPLARVTIWLDRPGLQAAWYVDMSRVRYDDYYRVGCIVRTRRVVPAM